MRYSTGYFKRQEQLCLHWSRTFARAQLRTQTYVKQEASPLLDPRVMRVVLPAAAAAAAGTALTAPPSSCGRCTHSLQTKLSVMGVESKCTSIIPHTAKVATFVLRLRLGGLVFALDDIPILVWTARGVRRHERSCRRACARCRRRRRRAKEWVAEGSPCTPSRRLRGRAADAAEREPLQCAQTRLLRPSIGHRGRDRQGWLILPDAAT